MGAVLNRKVNVGKDFSETSRALESSFQSSHSVSLSFPSSLSPNFFFLMLNLLAILPSFGELSFLNPREVWTRNFFCFLSSPFSLPFPLSYTNDLGGPPSFSISGSSPSRCSKRITVYDVCDLRRLFPPSPSFLPLFSMRIFRNSLLRRCQALILLPLLSRPS